MYVRTCLHTPVVHQSILSATLNFVNHNFLSAKHYRQENHIFLGGFISTAKESHGRQGNSSLVTNVSMQVTNTDRFAPRKIKLP